MVVLCLKNYKTLILLIFGLMELFAFLSFRFCFFFASVSFYRLIYLKIHSLDCYLYFGVTFAANFKNIHPFEKS